MGDGGAAAPMQVEVIKDDENAADDPTDEFITKGVKKGTVFQ